MTQLRQADEFFHVLQTLYVFISSSKAHEIYLSQQLHQHPDRQVHQMQRLSDTRWACRYAAVDTVCYTYDSILATIVSGDDKAKAVEASGIMHQIYSYQFLFLLILFSRILACTKRLSDQLQCADIDMSKAADLVSATIETLNEFRECWDQVIQYTDQVAALNDLSIHQPSSDRPRRTANAPRWLQDNVILSTSGVRDHL